MKLINRIKKLSSQICNFSRQRYRYCCYDVWTDMRSTLPVKIIKTLNLSVRAFFNGDIQTKACALTYRTMLAIVPALALIVAIGRGFGLQKMLQDTLIENFSSQRELLDKAFDFVNSYLNQTSSGVFVGVGIVVLLWTLVSILSSVEHAFNDIWGVKSGRSFWRKVTDYLAIFLILPVIMICAKSIGDFVPNNLEFVSPFEFMTPVVNLLLDFAALAMVWLFFAGVYMLIPNIKVKFRNALMAGIFAGTGFMILQWLFISGQVYVSKYNAIYGSFAFLPLLLIWLQMVWVICLAGGVICYASQNIYQYNFSDEIGRITVAYRLKIFMAIMAVTVKDFLNEKTPPSKEDIVANYGLPPRLVSSSVNFLVDAGLLHRVVAEEDDEGFGYVPAIDPRQLTVGEVIQHIQHCGSEDFIPDFNRSFSGVVDVMDKAEFAMVNAMSDTFVKDIIITDLITVDAEKASQQNNN